MKITFMTLQKASIVCLGVGMFLALGSAGTFETTGETARKKTAGRRKTSGRK